MLILSNDLSIWIDVLDSLSNSIEILTLIIGA